MKNILSFKRGIIFVVVLAILVIGLITLTPRINTKQISHGIIPSEVGETQAIIITIENRSIFPIKLKNTSSLITENLFHLDHGLIKNNGAISYHFLNSNNEYWDNLSPETFTELKIAPFSESSLYFVNRLDNKVGFIDGVVLHYEYMGNMRQKYLDNIRLCVLAESARVDLWDIVYKFYGRDNIK